MSDHPPRFSTAIHFYFLLYLTALDSLVIFLYCAEVFVQIAMSSDTSNDTVIRNPKESAAIFGCVVVLAVAFEFSFTYLRHHKSSYVAGLFVQMSEETMIVGCISLVFVFLVQSFPNLPDSWVELFRWAQGVIFFMILFFVVGVAWTALVTRVLCVMVQKFEFRLLQSLTRRQNTEVCDMLCREWRVGQLDEVSDKIDGDLSMNEELRRLLQRAVNNLGRLRSEFGALKEIEADDEDHQKKLSKKQHIEQALGDAALKLQDFFLEGSRFATGGLRDPEPQSALQSALLVLRKVFVHQVCNKHHMPVPMQGLLLTAERIRLTTFILDLEQKRRNLLAIRRAQREHAYHRRDAGHEAKKSDDVALTFEDLMLQREQRIAQQKVEASHVDETDLSIDQADDDLSASIASRGSNPSFFTSGSRAAELMAEKYVSFRSQGWVTDGCIDAELMCRYVPFSKYLYKRMRSIVVAFVDVTWQSWVSLILVSSVNSARLYLLPGQLQSKPALETDDYRKDIVSFIFVLGFGPMLGFLVAFVRLMRNFRWYLRSVRELRLKTFSTPPGGPEELDAGDTSADAFMTRMQRREEDNSGKKHVGASVWLPPEQLAGQLSGDLYEDPSRYLLRGNKSFTLHTLKIPALLVHYYWAIFVVKLWTTGGLGAGEVIGYVLLGCIPVIIVFGLLPVGLFAVTCLMSLGVRIDSTLVCFTAARQARRVSGNQRVLKREASADENGSNRSDDEEERDELLTLVAPLLTKSGDALSDGDVDADNDLAQRNLVRRVLGVLQEKTAGVSAPPPMRREGDVINASITEEVATMIGDDSTRADWNTSMVSDPLWRNKSIVAANLACSNEISVLKHKVKTLEDVLRATGLPLPAEVDGNGSNQRPRCRTLENPTSPDSFIGHQTADTMQDSPQEAQSLLLYYQQVMEEQGKQVKNLKKRIRELERTQRGGVLHPSFALQDDNGDAPTSAVGEQTHQPSSIHTQHSEIDIPQLPEAVLAARKLSSTTTASIFEKVREPRRRAKAPTRVAFSPIHKALDL